MPMQVFQDIETFVTNMEQVKEIQDSSTFMKKTSFTLPTPILNIAQEGYTPGCAQGIEQDIKLTL